MRGYLNNLRNAQYNLMNGRLGYTDRQDPFSNPLYPPEKFDENDSYKNAVLDNDVSGIQLMKNRLMFHGGVAQQDRMIYDKRRSLDQALLYSYQGANVSKVGEEGKIVRALINPNKLKKDYDDKIISIGFEYGFKTGDVFHWLGTDSHWLIYLQDLTELAYFRGDIRRCSYEVLWDDEDGRHHEWLALRGPVETKIDYIQKHQISVDNPNYSLNILMPKTDAAVKYFKRYAKFYVQDNPTCWRVEAVDIMSTPNIIELTAVEYYANETEDDIDAGLVGVLKPVPENPNAEQVEASITGDTFIKPQKVYMYTFNGNGGQEWKIDTTKYPVKYSINPSDSRQIQIVWEATFSGQFDITYGDTTKTIVVESLF